jgi:hypothetical protein
MVQHATIEEAMSSVDLTNAPIDWLDSDHVTCVYCRSMSVPRLYNVSHELLSSERIGTRSTEEYKRSACEDFTCDFKTYVCSSTVVLGVCDLVRLLRIVPVL